MAQEYFEIVFRLVAALVAGGLVGLERSHRGRPAGFRTHALVCLASTLLMLVTVYGSHWIPRANRAPERLPCPLDVLRAGAGQSRDDGPSNGRGNCLYRGKVAFRCNREARRAGKAEEGDRHRPELMLKSPADGLEHRALLLGALAEVQDVDEVVHTNIECAGRPTGRVGGRQEQPERRQAGRRDVTSCDRGRRRRRC